VSELLYDTLRAFEDRAVTILQGLGSVTRRDLGFSAEVPAGASLGLPWIDITIVRASSQEQRGRAQTVTVQTALRVVVVGTDWPRVADLVDWTAELAEIRIRDDAELRQLFAVIQSTDTRRTAATPSGNPEIELTLTIRSEIQYRQPGCAALGLLVTLDADDSDGTESRGHALYVYGPRLVTWATITPQAAPYAPIAMYANAQAGDAVRVLDANDVEVALVPVVSFPANDLAMPSLAAGVYTLEMGGVRSLHTLTISEAPS